MTLRFRLLVAVLLLLVASVAHPPAAHAYVEVPFTLGRVVNESTVICLMRVEKVDREKNLIVFRKVRDIKGTQPGDVVKHNIAKAGFHPREWQTIMTWAEVGKSAMFFHNGSAGECCIDNYWYQIYPGDWWAMSHAEPYLLRTFAGKPEKLATIVEQMLKGQEVAVPCMVDGDKNAIQLRQAKVQRVKASLKIMDYDAKRDFAGWGVEDIRVLQGMPGFSHYGALGRVDPAAAGVSPADFDGDGKVDFCLFGEGRAVVFQNTGGAFNEISLPLATGARSAAWADVDGDGKLDLLLACPGGPRLFINEGEQKFKDVSNALPQQKYWNLTAATFIDADTDGRPDILLADTFTGLRLWRNLGTQAPPKPPTIESAAWKIIGPFDNTDNRGYDTAHPPERELKFDAKYTGKGNFEAAWKAFDFPEGQIQSVKVFRDDLHTFMVVYAHRVITASGPGEMNIALGGGGPIKVWLNGQLIVADNQQRQPAPDQVQCRLPLKQGANDLLIKYCYVQSGRSAYYKSTLPEAPVVRQYEDITDRTALPGLSLGKAHHLLPADVNGDGRMDVLVGAGEGVLLMNMPQGLTPQPASGIAYRPAGVQPLLADLNGDGKIDLLIPQNGSAKLLLGSGTGTFADATARAGDLGTLRGHYTSAATADLTGDGRPDLLLGTHRGPNRLLAGKADGTFADVTEAFGLDQKIFNTRGVALLDLNRDRTPDLLLANEGQESNLLLSSPERPRVHQ